MSRSPQPLPPSSPTYSADLRPDPRLRRLLRASGIALYLVGAVMIAGLPLAAGGRVVLLLAWLCLGAYEWLSLRRGHAAHGLLRIDVTGALSCCGSDGEWRAARLLPGSVVTARFAWLRVRVDDGTRYAELVRGEIRESEDWRRFQVIWRHVGAVSRSC